MSSSDGFCSALTFAPGELGNIYHPPPAASARPSPAPISVTKANSAASTPQPTPTGSTAPSQAPLAVPGRPASNSNPPPPQPGAIPRAANASPAPMSTIPGAFGGRPASPARSMSASSIATEASFARVPDQNAPPVMNNPTPSLTSLPSLAAAGSSNPVTSSIPLFTPPQTPGQSQVGGPAIGAPPAVSGVKRESVASAVSESEDQGREKRRRVAPTLVEGEGAPRPPPNDRGGGGQ